MTTAALPTGRFVIGATWDDDAPHLNDAAKERLKASYPAYQRDARTKGIPQLGSGAIYPFDEALIKVPDFPLPPHWSRGLGADCPDSSQAGTMACAWGAWDRDSDVLYIYSVYRRAQAETSTHAEAMKARGMWIPGAMDGAALLDKDRTQYIEKFRGYGFDLLLPDKSLEAGIQTVYDRISEGRLKVFASCSPFFEEFRVYRRDARGRVVKKNDHVMDAVRYLAHSGMIRMVVEPKSTEAEAEEYEYELGSSGDLGWMAN